MAGPFLKFDFTLRLQQFCHSLRRTNTRLLFSGFSVAKSSEGQVMMRQSPAQFAFSD
jgi:hypothetical protein